MLRLLAVLLLLLSVSGGALAAYPSPTGHTLVLGRSFSGTGFSASEADPITHGVNFWYDWLIKNNNGGIWNNGVFYPVELLQYDDASQPSTCSIIYEDLVYLRNVTAVFGPWTQNLTATILPILQDANMPFVNTGAAGGTLFTGEYSFMVSMLVNGAKRSLPCFQLFAARGAKTAVILYNSDTYETSVGSIVYPAQLAALNITVLYTTTFLKGSTEFGGIIDTIAKLPEVPDFFACAQQQNDFGPMLETLRKLIPTSRQPKAIMNADTTSIQVTYTGINGVPGLFWMADATYGGDEWSPNFAYRDAIFGDTTNFTAIYYDYLRSVNSSDQIVFWDAASAMGGFVMQKALENADNFTHEGVVAALRAVTFNTSFYGPVSFLPTGEFNGSGICQQLMPSPNANASFTSTKNRDVQVVWPLDVQSNPAYYPAPYHPPPPPSQFRKRLAVGLSVPLGVILLGAIIGGVIYAAKTYHLLFLPKKEAEGDWQ